MLFKRYFSKSGICPSWIGFWLLISVLLAESLAACGPRVLVGPSRSDPIKLPYPVAIVAEKSVEPGGYMPGDPFDVFWMAKDGQLHRVTNHLERNPRASWSPDGKTVAFWIDLRTGDGFYYHLYTAASNGADIGPLTTQVGSTRSGGSTVKWSPRGDRLAFLANDGGQEYLFVIDRDGSNLVKLMETGLLFSSVSYEWSPSGDHIAAEFEYGDHVAIHLIQLTAEPKIVDLTSNQPISAKSAWSPAWSPDGSRIAYYSDAGIVVMDMSTREIKVLTDDYGRTNSSLGWSPDGNWIAFVARLVVDMHSECPNEKSGTSEYLHLVASDGSQFTRLTPIQGSFSWSPDSKKVAFSKCENIYTMDITGESGSRKHKLVFNEKGHVSEPIWSPDGSVILFAVTQVHVLPDRSFVTTLHAINADGSNRLMLTDGSTNVHKFSWLDKW